MTTATLHQTLNWTTGAGFVLALAIVALAWLRARPGSGSGPGAVSAGATGVRPPGQDTTDGPHDQDGPSDPAGTLQLQAPAAARPAAHGPVPLGELIQAGPVWTASDSWLTTVTGIGGGLLATVAANYGGGGSEAAWLLGVYALSAALAPLVYGALSPGASPAGGERTGAASPAGGERTGTVGGYLLAALATLFGGIGLVATMAALGIVATDAVAPGLVLGIAGAVIIAAMCLYAARTITAVLQADTGPAAGRPASRTASLLVGTTGRRSATL